MTEATITERKSLSEQLQALIDTTVGKDKTFTAPEQFYSALNEFFAQLTCHHPDIKPFQASAMDDSGLAPGHRAIFRCIFSSKISPAPNNMLEAFLKQAEQAYQGPANSMDITDNEIRDLWESAAASYLRRRAYENQRKKISEAFGMNAPDADADISSGGLKATARPRSNDSFIIQPTRTPPRSIATRIKETARQMDEAEVYDAESFADISYTLLLDIIASIGKGSEEEKIKQRNKVLSEVFPKERFEHILSGLQARASQPDHAAIGSPKALQSLIQQTGIAESLQPTALRCLLGIPFQPKQGACHIRQILDYAQAHPEFRSVEALEMAAVLAGYERARVKSFCQQVLKMTPKDYERIIRSTPEYTIKSSYPPDTEAIEKYGREIGCHDEKDMLRWRQLVSGSPLGLDAGHHQKELNGYFAPGANRPANPQTNCVRFLTLLKHAHGLHSNSDLAHHIAKKITHNIPEKYVCQAINFYYGEDPADANHNQFKQAVKALPQAVAQFAFPLPNQARQHTLCTNVLTSCENMRNKTPQIVQSSSVPEESVLPPKRRPISTSYGERHRTLTTPGRGR